MLEDCGRSQQTKSLLNRIPTIIVCIFSSFRKVFRVKHEMKTTLSVSFGILFGLLFGIKNGNLRKARNILYMKIKLTFKIILISIVRPYSRSFLR